MQRKSKPVPEFLSVPEFAARVGRTRQAINQAILKGWIPGAVRRPGPRRQPWSIPVAALDIYKA